MPKVRGKFKGYNYNIDIKSLLSADGSQYDNTNSQQDSFEIKMRDARQ